MVRISRKQPQRHSRKARPYELRIEGQFDTEDNEHRPLQRSGLNLFIVLIARDGFRSTITLGQLCGRILL
jgi:hypothetical protein